MTADRVVPQPQNLEVGETLQVLDFAQIFNQVFAQIKLRKLSIVLKVPERADFIQRKGANLNIWHFFQDGDILQLGPPKVDVLDLRELFAFAALKHLLAGQYFHLNFEYKCQCVRAI